jgi:hypothetical protein
MKDKFSHLDTSHPRWVRKVGRGFSPQDYKTLRMLGFNDDHISFQLIQVRRHDRAIPAWATNDSQIRALINKTFPKWQTLPSQRKVAGRWSLAINLYYKMSLSDTETADEMGISRNAAKCLLQRIRHEAEGM